MTCYSEFSYSNGFSGNIANQRICYYVKHDPVKENQDGIMAIAYAVKAYRGRPETGSKKWLPGGFFPFYDMSFFRTITTRQLPNHLREVVKK